MTNVDGGESLFWYSYDRGHNWEGPVRLPDFNSYGTAARTDYILYSKDECLLFLTSARANGQEGRVMCTKSQDGGVHWTFVSWIGEEPSDYSIMPASVRLSDQEILVAVRTKKGNSCFIEAYLSNDKGLTWQKLVNPVDDTGEGNPPAMVKMSDGRVCLVYGDRKEPFSICATISNDKGKTWSKVYTLRDDGSGRDIGYPRVVQRPDGKIVVIYYFMDEKTGRERYVGATIWTPPSPGEEIY
jgi:Neuraminidase (sialidase)